MLLSRVCGTWSILTCNVIPHICFTLSISCVIVMLLFHVCGSQPICCLLVMPFPMSTSLFPTGVYCYVAVPCLRHLVHLLNRTCNFMPDVRFTLSNSCLLLCFSPMSVALSAFTVLLVMPCPMSVALCPSAVYRYVFPPGMWHSVHLLSYW